MSLNRQRGSKGHTELRNDECKTFKSCVARNIAASKQAKYFTPVSSSSQHQCCFTGIHHIQRYSLYISNSQVLVLSHVRPKQQVNNSDGNSLYTQSRFYRRTPTAGSVWMTWSKLSLIHDLLFSLFLQ